MDSPGMPPTFFTVLLFVSLQTLGCAKQDCSGPTGQSFIFYKCKGTTMLEELNKEHLKDPSSSVLIPSLYLVVIFIGFPANMLAL
ncbi:proteinase-activated receptor 3-like [Huso huso]|uniref:Proteinase-activated receptor 3-like n=1 Tax=Huso huso TaxID=61971 RepID=A0ABR0YTF3_HUSHU